MILLAAMPPPDPVMRGASRHTFHTKNFQGWVSVGHGELDIHATDSRCLYIMRWRDDATGATPDPTPVARYVDGWPVSPHGLATYGDRPGTRWGNIVMYRHASGSFSGDGESCVVLKITSLTCEPEALSPDLQAKEPGWIVRDSRRPLPGLAAFYRLGRFLVLRFDTPGTMEGVTATGCAAVFIDRDGRQAVVVPEGEGVDVRLPDGLRRVPLCPP